MPGHTHTVDVDKTVKRFKKASRKFLKEIKNDPQKAKDFLIRAGIARKSKKHPTEIELVPELREKA